MNSLKRARLRLPFFNSAWIICISQLILVAIEITSCIGNYSYGRTGNVEGLLVSLFGSPVLLFAITWSLWRNGPSVWRLHSPSRRLVGVCALLLPLPYFMFHLDYRAADLGLRQRVDRVYGISALQRWADSYMSKPFSALPLSVENNDGPEMHKVDLRQLPLRVQRLIITSGEAPVSVWHPVHRKPYIIINILFGRPRSQGLVIYQNGTRWQVPEGGSAWYQVWSTSMGSYLVQ